MSQLNPYILLYTTYIMSQSADVNDPYFMANALSMGYTRQQLQPISIDRIYENSLNTHTNMNDNERKFYVQKKYKAMKERQQKIMNKIHEEKTYHNYRQNRRGFNPAIKKLLEDHEVRMEKKARYQQRVRVSKTRDAQVRKISNTIDFGRTSPNFSTSAKNSRVSKQSMRSQNSVASSKSTSSHKERLMFVRLKEKQVQKFKKNIFQHNQNESKKKIEKVHQSRLQASRRIKTKSQISQQSVQERKEELNSLRQDQIRGHIEKLKYKMLKNEYIKQKQQQRRINQSAQNDGFYKKQLKNMFEQNQKQHNRMRYESKLRSVQRNKKQIQQQKRREIQKKLKEKKLKQLQVMKYKEHRTIQQQQKKKMTLFYEYNSIERANQRRNQIQSEKKMRLLENKVKQEIVKSNFNAIENRRKLESQVKARQISEKLKQINDIQTIKRKLTRERNRNSFTKVQDQDYKFSFY